MEMEKKMLQKISFYTKVSIPIILLSISGRKKDIVIKIAMFSDIQTIWNLFK